ncbi:MAG: small ribosomal subunit Rsm22 family protein [Treponema sp.]|jgi:hypothetical protein|nr:small ribosomal subunit Rsm22 family protein [Treponema sp.]
MLFPPLDKRVLRELDGLLDLVGRVFPLQERFRRSLPKDVAELSRLLTSGRGSRDTGYLGRPALLSAYLYHYLPWNVFRLCRLLAGLAAETRPAPPLSESEKKPPLGFAAGDTITDLGSGPLTLPVALWISFPELRSCRLEFRCVDRTGAVLDAGRKLFDALVMEAGGPRFWNVKTIRGPLDAPLYGKAARFAAAVNVFNEIKGPRSLEHEAEKAALLLSRVTGDILVMEPGTPPSARFLERLRAALLARGFVLRAPCPHSARCPMSGDKNKKWCHFPMTTSGAPARLKALSAAAGIPKERAVLSFLFAGKNRPEPPAALRVISDAFPLPAPRRGTPESLPAERYGRYCCHGQGLALLRGSAAEIDSVLPGALVKAAACGRDSRSGALLYEGIRP